MAMNSSRRRPARGALRALIGVLGATLTLVGLPVTAAQAVTTETIFTPTSTPTTPSYTADTAAVELGAKFTANTSGTVDGVQFYHVAGAGTYYVHLWNASGGSPLATGSISGLSTSGWQSVSFPAVGITAGTTYVVSYLAPNGGYAYDAPSQPGGLASAKTSPNGILTEPSSSTSGGNGVYKYPAVGATSAFPSNNTAGSNYWVGPVFEPGASAPPPPPATSLYATNYVPSNPDGFDNHPTTLGVRFQSQTGGYISGVRFYKSTANTGTHIGSLWTSQNTLLAQATFTSETATGWQDVKFADMVPIKAGVTYTASYFAPNGRYAYDAGGLTSGITNPPLMALPGTSGGNGMYAPSIAPAAPILASPNNADYAVDVDFTPTYSAPTVTQPAPRAGTVGSGAVLVLTDPANHFSEVVCGGILATKGITCASTDAGNLTTASVLSPYKTVIVAEQSAPLTTAQVNLLTTWATGGGDLIVMKPASNLNSLTGIGDRTGDQILADAYLGIDTSQAPGLGTTATTLQYHGVADLHPLVAGTRAVAMLYANATAVTAYPAITTRTIGTGTVWAWMFDLARSTVYTRNGNPGYTGLATVSSDGYSRVADRLGRGFLDLSRVTLPQLDYQVTLLANQIQRTTYPVPIKAALPAYKPNANHPNGYLKAAFVLTGDDHAGDSHTLSRFQSETAASPAGCTTAAWTCIRSTSNAYPNAFTDAAVKPYTDAGFEVVPHVAGSGTCAGNWTSQAQLDTLVTAAIGAWGSSYPTISAAHPPQSQRFHCYGAWNDYASVAKVEAAHGMTTDTNTSCWPSSFFANVSQCLPNGSGLPMAYADADGSLTGAYQFTTQATDENPSTVTQTALDGLAGSAITNGNPAYLTVLAHLDDPTANADHADSTATEQAVLAVAAARDIPVVSAAQAGTFWAARQATGVANPTYSASTVSFAVATPAANLLMMQPTKYGTKTVTTIKRGSTTLSFTTITVGGVSYAVFPAGTAGTYTATYA